MKTGRSRHSLRRMCRKTQSSFLWALVFVPGMFLACGSARGPEPAGDVSWEFQLGSVYRTDTRIKANWSGEGIAARVLPLLAGQRSGTSLAGPANSYADRDYADGFVYMDPGTADPETDTMGLTWHWGYDNPEQYTGASVRFHGLPVQDYWTEGLAMDPWSGSEKINQAGLDLSCGWRAWKWEWGALGVSAGLNWLPEREADFKVSRTVARENRRTWRIVDTYDAPYLPFPDAPYAGTYEGPGYLIHNIPDSRNIELMSASSREWVAESQVKVEVEVVDLRLGPSLWLRPHDRVALRVTPQIRFAQVETRGHSRTAIASPGRSPKVFEERCRDRNWVMGGGVEAEARFYLGKGWHLGFAVASDWWEDDVGISADPFEVLLELGQWSFVGSLGVEF